jgi:hypothetical protein
MLLKFYFLGMQVSENQVLLDNTIMEKNYKNTNRIIFNISIFISTIIFLRTIGADFVTKKVKINPDTEATCKIIFVIFYIKSNSN